MGCIQRLGTHKLRKVSGGKPRFLFLTHEHENYNNPRSTYFVIKQSHCLCSSRNTRIPAVTPIKTMKINHKQTKNGKNLELSFCCEELCLYDSHRAPRSPALFHEKWLPLFTKPLHHGGHSKLQCIVV